jgi:peptidoglycan/xylan/chitin deacetylase (PgdA/CDA1 family)
MVNGSYIALTFDDGPHATNTSKLLDLAEQTGIKLTFFVVGECVQKNPNILRRASVEGHEIGNHSWSHPNLAKLSDEHIRTELKATHQLVADIVGTEPKLMRPPYGELSQIQRQWIRDEFNYTIVLWDVDPVDWERPGSNIVATRIISNTRASSIVLSHDTLSPTIQAMPEVFDTLLQKGFTFVTVSKLLALKKGVVEKNLNGSMEQ